MEAIVPDADWEAMYAPYDRPTYEAVLAQVQAEDVILDIGAGDLRLARRMARIARRVYAVESNAQLVDPSIRLPASLVFICADARTLDFPRDITTGVLLMRHCSCFGLYAEKLRQAGATRLITNARWRMGVEGVDLWAPRRPFRQTGMGWYACLCGGAGFKEGPAEHWTPEMDQVIHEVSDCPQCSENTMSFSPRSGDAGRLTSWETQ